MTARTLARTTNNFERSPRSLAVDALLNTREVAALLHLHPSSVRSRAARLGLPRIRGTGYVRYWSPWEIQQLEQPV